MGPHPFQSWPTAGNLSQGPWRQRELCVTTNHSHLGTWGTHFLRILKFPKRERNRTSRNALWFMGVPPVFELTESSLLSPCLLHSLQSRSIQTDSCLVLFGRREIYEPQYSQPLTSWVACCIRNHSYGSCQRKKIAASRALLSAVSRPLSEVRILPLLSLPREAWCPDSHTPCHDCFWTKSNMKGTLSTATLSKGQRCPRRLELVAEWSQHTGLGAEQPHSREKRGRDTNLEYRSEQKTLTPSRTVAHNTGNPTWNNKVWIIKSDELLIGFWDDLYQTICIPKTF